MRNAPEADSTATDFGGEVEEPACSFAGLRLEADGTLWRGEAVVHLPPKELAALRRLLAHAGQVVSPTQLKHELWGDVHVTDDSVSKCLSSLRARLEPDACIQTVYKRGYRFSAEIRRHRAVPAGRLPRLAIMPFATRYSVPEYLGPAIAEETIARLSSARPPAVAVLARDSVFSLTLRGLTAQQIGQELKADLVLTGSIRAFPSHYRLRAEMVRVEDGRQIWVEDMLASQSLNGGLESELMCRLAFRLSQGDPDVRFWPPERPEQKNGGLEIAATAAGTEDEDEPGARQAEAYDYFLRGHHEWQTPHRHRMQDGLQHLLRAIDLDPSLIVAKVDLANLCVTQAFCGFMSPSTSADLVRRVAESIPDLPHRAEAIPPALGWINFHFDRNLSSALLAFSLETPPPHDSWTTYTHTIFALSRHRFAEAIALLRANIHADPFSPCLYARLAWALHLDGQKGESVEQIRKALALFPHHEGTGLYGAAILAFNGEIEHAVELARGLAKRLPDSDLASAVHAYTLACAGRPDEAHSLLERLQWLGRERYVLRSFTPAAYLALGEHETALAELQAAEEARCPWFFQMMADPRLKALQGCPEFERMRAILPSMEAEAEQD